MGLCKCPKKKVTNQFCFEHRVNVCEFCIVDEHQKCIVQSYLQWLNDSDYNPVCQLCKKLLVYSDCIRLVCYDVFHIRCLDSWANNFPPNTAPAGYSCPICASPVFPASNVVSPVADALREVLASFTWARTGLGLPLVHSSSIERNGAATPSSTVSSEVAQTHYKSDIHRGTPDGHDVTSNSEVFDSSSNAQVWGPPSIPVSRKHSDNSSTIFFNAEDDIGENKYRKRSAMEWFGRWMRTLQKPSSRHHQGLFGRRNGMIFILVALIIISLLVVLSFYGRSASDDDPMLDPFNNPNIRVEE